MIFVLLHRYHSLKSIGGSCKTSMQNKAIFYFHFDIFIFENKVDEGKMQLDGQIA